MTRHLTGTLVLGLFIAAGITGPATPAQKNSHLQSAPVNRNAVVVAPPSNVIQLTSGECKGLGGKVTTTAVCSASGQKACKTVNFDGVVNVACIDEKKN